MPEIKAFRPLGPVREAPLTGGQWGNRLGASIDSYQANLYGVAEAATGARWATEGRESNEADAEYQREMARRQGAVSSYKDVGSVGDAANYLGGLAVDSAPYLAEAAVGGLVGRGLAFGARAAGSAAREMGMVAAERGAATQVGRYGLAGGAVASYPSSVGDVLNSQREETGGRMDLLSAAGLGVPYAALNAVGVEGALARGGMTRNAMRALDEAQGFSGAAKRGATSAGVSALQEGASETGQELLNQVGRNAVNSNAGYTSDAALDRYGESFVGGAALGGLFGAAGGWRPSQEYVTRQADVQRTQQEQTAAAEAEQARQAQYRGAAMGNVFEGGIPLQQFLQGMQAALPMDDKARAAYESQFESMLSAPTGQRVAVAETGLERPVLAAETLGLPPTPDAPAAEPQFVPDERAVTALGQGSSKRMLTIGTDLYRLVDEGKATEDEIDTHLNAMADPRTRRFIPIETFIKERSNAQPGVPGPAGLAAGAVDGGVAQPGGSAGNLGGVPADPTGLVRGAAGQLVASGAEAVPVGDGVRPGDDAALDVPLGDQLKNRFRQVLNRVPPTVQKRVLDALGMGADMNFLPEGRKTFDQIGQENPGKPISRQAVEKSVRKFLTQLAGDKKAMSPSDLAAVASMNDWFQANSGETAATTPKPGKAPLESDAFEGGEAFEGQVQLGTNRIEGPQGETVATADETAVEGDIAPEQAEDLASMEDVASDFDLETLVAEQPQAEAGSTEGILAPQIAKGEIIPTDFAESEQEWDEQRLDTDPAWADLKPKHQAAWIRSYARGAANAESQERIIAQRSAENGQAQPTVAGPGSPGGSRPGRAGSQAVAAGGTAARASAPAQQVQVAAAAQPAAAEVADRIATPKEAWGTLAAATPGMPAWDSLNGSQRTKWTDLHHRSQGNLAAASRVAGESLVVNKSVNADDSVTLDDTETRPVSRATLFARPGFDEAMSRLQKLGLGHLVNWVRDYRVAPATSRAGETVADGWVTGRPGRGVHLQMTMNGNLDAATARWVVSHEMGHVADLAPYGGVYSSSPRMQAVVDELQAVYDNAEDGSLWDAVLEYPFGMAVEADQVAGEAFAQLFASYVSPALRAKLKTDAPVAHAFIEEAIRAIRTQSAPSSAVESGAEIAARSKSFTGTAGAQGRQRTSASANGQDAGRAKATVASKGGTTAAQAAAAFEAEQTRANKVFSAMPAKAQDGYTNISDWFKKHSPWVLTSFQLAQQYGDKITALVKYVALADAAKKERTRLQMEFHHVATDWDKLPEGTKTRLNGLMQRATMQEMHPDLPFEHKDNAHLNRKDPAELAAMKAAHAKLQVEYKVVGPTAQAVYQRAKKVLADSWEARSKAYQGMVDSTYSERITEALETGDTARVETLRAEGEAAQKDYSKQMASIKGPYFPLMRFGEYLAIGESSAYTQLKEEVAGVKGESRAKLQAKLDVMKRDPAHYQVSAHEDRASRDRKLTQLESQGLAARGDMADVKLDQLRAVTQDTVKHLEDALSTRLDADLAGPAKDALQQVFLRGLPEMHALRREAQRKGVEGANADMLRAFSAAGQSNAFYASRLLYAKQMADTMFEMKAEVKGDTDLQHIQREMQKRMALDMKYTDTPVQDLFSSLTWAYQLGVSPAAVAINATQPFLVSAPVLAGKFGMVRATKEVSRAARDSLAVLKAARFKDGKWDWWSGISEDSILGPSRNEDRAAIRVLLQRGILDEGMQHELNMFAQDSSRWLGKINRVMGWATQQVEVSNRMTTALAAFRLARKDGMTEADATDYAYRTVQGTQFDYSAEGSARIMREGGGVPLAKLVFQFRRYQQGMLYLLGDNIKKSFGEGAEAKQARATLAYLSITTGMTAGVMGLPFMGVALTIANALRDDDDKDGDASVALRNILVDMTGDKDTATVLAKGLPALFGADLSKRIGLADVASPIPFARYEQAKTGRDVARETLFSIAGPAAGLGAQVADGMMLFAHGDFTKGIEKMVPKSIADPIKASRYAFGDGLTDTRGDQILGSDEVGAWNAALRAVGVQSTTESNYYEGNAAKQNTKKAIEDRKNRISNEFKSALRSGDFESVREKIAEFNDDHPENRILPKDEVRWRKDSIKSQGQRDASGIRVDPKRDKNYQDVMRFAR